MGTSEIDLLWIVICSAFVFFMQAGFLCLHSAGTRKENYNDIAIKTFFSFCMTTLIFWIMGFALMFGTSYQGLFGIDFFAINFSELDGSLTIFFLFQLMLCAVVVAIVSVAVVERLRFGAYFFIALIVSGLIYPIAGHWTWLSRSVVGGVGWLNNIGFIDFSGSTVVHSVGGWVSLALVMVVGSRHERSSKIARDTTLYPSNLSFVTLGVVILFLGWFGINGGSVLGFNDQVPPVLINTLVAGSAGTISAGILSYGSYQQANISHFLRGALSGLVAISASCYAVSTPTAAIIGLVGGMVVIFGEKMLEYLKIEDAVGIIPVHLGAGIWGTLALGMYGKYEILDTGLSRFEQIGIQVLGIAVYGIWAFGVAYLIFKTLNYFLPLRASFQDEQVNLDVVQHPKFEQSEIIRDKN